MTSESKGRGGLSHPRPACKRLAPDQALFFMISSATLRGTGS